jgi:DNA-binding MarR family transcriptional regulator
MTVNDDEEKVLKVFARTESDDIRNKELMEASGLDEDSFSEALRALEAHGFIERYIGHTALLLKGRMYLQRTK